MLRAEIIPFVFFFLLFVSGAPPNPDITALQSFRSSLVDTSNALSSWSTTNSSAAATPCSASWVGVTCNPATHRVVRLVLEDLNLTGSLLPLSGLSQLRVLSIKNNSFSSLSNLNFSSWPNLKHLYLSHNRLSGLFPPGILHLRRLRRLDLSHNYFHGSIPIAELASLPWLLTLRLEVNSFTGNIDSVGLSSSVVDFNVSGNNLFGEIPTWLSRFPASSFAENENLCGPPLLRKCVNQTVGSEPVELKDPSRTRKKLSKWIVIMIVSVDAVAVVAVVLTIACCCYYKKGKNKETHEGEMRKKDFGFYPQIGRYGGGVGGREEGEEMVVFEGCKGFRGVDDLLKSSAELLGKGCVGTTYKVVMDNGEVAVVKRIRERRKKREVDGSLKLIGGLRHPNIVSLRAFYSSKEELLLVYDFLPNGSLYSLLHGNRGPGRTPLEWSTRLKLASDSANGLAFLHGYNKAKLFHGNLNSSNIIVDHLGNACISDIGLYQLLHTQSFSNSSYKAPELSPNNNNSNNISQRKYTQKCDIYSFGIVLLEILTGKMLTGGDGETSLVKWVQRAGREEWAWDVFDFELLRYKEMEDEMVALMQVALLCLAPLPRDRPKMSIIHGMIEDIRNKGVSGAGRNSIMNDLSSDSSPAQSENAVGFNM